MPHYSTRRAYQSSEQQCVRNNFSASPPRGVRGKWRHVCALRRSRGGPASALHSSLHAPTHSLLRGLVVGPLTSDQFPPPRTGVGDHFRGADGGFINHFRRNSSQFDFLIMSRKGSDDQYMINARTDSRLQGRNRPDSEPATVRSFYLFLGEKKIKTNKQTTDQIQNRYLNPGAVSPRVLHLHVSMP